jgi:hypothetical protein
VHSTGLDCSVENCSNVRVGNQTISGGSFTKNAVGRMASSWMLRHVALVRTDVSKELSVTRIGEPDTMLAVTTNRRTLRRNFFAILHSHSRENLKSYNEV